MSRTWVVSKNIVPSPPHYIVGWRLQVTTHVRDIVDLIIFFIWEVYKNPFPGGWHYTTLEQIEIMAQQWGPVPKNAANINFQVIS